MTNSRRRCSRCHQYKPVGELATAGIQAHCKGGCAPAEKTSRDGTERSAPKRKVVKQLARTANLLDPELRAEVLSRDGWRCVFCDSERSLHAHHIQLRSHGRVDELWNLITLCRHCHADVVHQDVRRWTPALRAYIWLIYTTGVRWRIPELEEGLAA